MEQARKKLVITTLPDTTNLANLPDSDFVVAALVMHEAIIACLEALETSLAHYPPTSLDKAKATWLPRARKLGELLSQQIAERDPSTWWNDVPTLFSQIIVASERIIPIDLIPCRDGLLGAECVIAHAVAEESSDMSAILQRSLENHQVPLRRIAHVCTYYPGTTPLHEMDVLAATLKINNELAIEHYFYPCADISAGLFKRIDLDILHFECHGTPTSLQIDNPYGDPRDVRAFYSCDGPSVYFFLGCNVGSCIEGTAPVFVAKGAKAAIGSYSKFFSGGDSGEVSTATFYDALYQSLLGGKSLGESLKAGRQAAAPERIYYCSWLLFGNPNLRFSLRRYGIDQIN